MTQQKTTSYDCLTALRSTRISVIHMRGSVTVVNHSCKRYDILKITEFGAVSTFIAGKYEDVIYHLVYYFFEIKLI